MDLIAKQVFCMREQFGHHVKFMSMNSFRTSDDTFEVLRTKYPCLAEEEGLKILSRKVPTLDANTLEVIHYFNVCHLC